MASLRLNGVPSAEKLISAIVDPCSYPPQHIPDEYHGHCQLLTTVTSYAASSDGSGNRGWFFGPGNGDAIKESGASTWTTVTDRDDAQTSILASDYTQVRVIGMCVDVEYVGAATDKPGILSIAHVDAYTSLFGADADAMRVSINALKPYTVAANKSVPQTWKPKSSSDLVPWVPSNQFDSDNDVSGRLLSLRGGIYILLTSATASSSNYNITVTRHYECFLTPARQFMAPKSIFNDTAMLDAALTAAPSVPIDAEPKAGRRLAIATLRALGAGGIAALAALSGGMALPAVAAIGGGAALTSALADGIAELQRPPKRRRKNKKKKKGKKKKASRK
jgi:hypothetical protein